MRHRMESWVIGMHARHCTHRYVVVARIVVWGGLAVAWLVVALR